MHFTAMSGLTAMSGQGGDASPNKLDIPDVAPNSPGRSSMSGYGSALG